MLTSIRGYFFPTRSIGEDPQLQLALNGNFVRWALPFLKKCSYKWRPGKFLGPDVAILFIYIFKNDENFPKTQKFFHFLKIKFNKFVKFGHPKKNQPPISTTCLNSKEKKKTCTFETCSKSNDMLNATPHLPHLIPKYINHKIVYLIFF